MIDIKEIHVGMLVTWHDKSTGYTMKEVEERENGDKFGIVHRIDHNDISVEMKVSHKRYSFLLKDLDPLDTNEAYFLSLEVEKI